MNALCASRPHSRLSRSTTRWRLAAVVSPQIAPPCPLPPIEPVLFCTIWYTRFVAGVQRVGRARLRPAERRGLCDGVRGVRGVVLKLEDAPRRLAPGGRRRAPPALGGHGLRRRGARRFAGDMGASGGVLRIIGEWGREKATHRLKSETVKQDRLHREGNLEHHALPRPTRRAFALACRANSAVFQNLMASADSWWSPSSPSWWSSETPSRSRARGAARGARRRPGRGRRGRALGAPADLTPIATAVNLVDDAVPASPAPAPARSKPDSGSTKRCSRRIGAPSRPCARPRPSSCRRTRARCSRAPCSRAAAARQQAARRLEAVHARPGARARAPALARPSRAAARAPAASGGGGRAARASVVARRARAPRGGRAARAPPR